MKAPVDEHHAPEDDFLERPLVQRALDWGINGSLLAILLLVALYIMVPEEITSTAGSIDRRALLLAGGGAILFLVLMRLILRSRIRRWNCLPILVITSLGAFLIFWLLMQFFDTLF